MLGSTRRKLAPGDVPVILDLLARHKIGYWFLIGGNDSALTGHALSDEAARAGYDLAVVNIPKTVDNDLVLTDHCPGYGSAARFVALATMGSGRDAEAMGPASPITIIEVMGRDAGWLAAASGLARREERDAPHLICVPEAPVGEDWFVARIEDAYARYGFAVAVVSENARGPKASWVGSPSHRSSTISAILTTTGLPDIWQASSVDAWASARATRSPERSSARSSQRPRLQICGRRSWRDAPPCGQRSMATGT